MATMEAHRSAFFMVLFLEQRVDRVAKRPDKRHPVSLSCSCTTDQPQAPSDWHFLEPFMAMLWLEALNTHSLWNSSENHSPTEKTLPAFSSQVSHLFPTRALMKTRPDHAFNLITTLAFFSSVSGQCHEAFSETFTFHGFLTVFVCFAVHLSNALNHP